MAEKFEYTREWTNADAFPRLGFTKSWENPEDYPTIETDETQVRKDMQSLHDEVKDYINTKLIPAILAEDATEEARASAEAARDAAEQARASAEGERAAAEQARVEAENGRVSAEAARVTAEQERAAAEQARADENTGIVAQATAQAEAAAASASEASGYKASAQKYAGDAEYYAQNLRAEVTRAAAYASDASKSATAASASETAAKASETAAAASAEAAAASAARAEEVVGGDYATRTELGAHTGNTDIHVTAEEKAGWNAKADALFKPAGKSYLTFSSPNSFTLKVYDATKHWDGTLEYFASDKTWTTWDGTATLSAVDNDGEYVLYLRGTGNTVITGNDPVRKWMLTGANVKCNGNIENLLDYVTVESGEHPTMAEYCYNYLFDSCASLTQAPSLPATTLANFCYCNMFQNCTSLTQAPALPATTLANYCYNTMFRGCTGLTQAPALPATTLGVSCYVNMFSGCTALTQAPALPATTLANYCYSNMFNGCTSLTKVPALPATTLVIYCYYNMFYGCTKIKVSSTQTGEYAVAYRIPTDGTGTTATDALTDMFASTGGTFTGTPEINTTYYLSSDNMVVRETEIATLNGYVGSMIDAAGPKTATVTLAAASWDSTAKTQTVTVTGVSATETAQLITPVPALASQAAYYDAGILCTAQAVDSLTFTCTTVPTEDLTVYVVIQEVTQG